ncbi:putative RNA-dependent RNA polymerase [Freshwater macrophyte associated sobeli-like virus 2]|nr:putative RNA-dependent RNA polymerase [Freshwater macrophyte associated sobeli-like virus 2]
MRIQSEKARINTERYVEPTQMELDTILLQSEMLFKEARWSLPENWCSYEAFLEAVRRIDKSSSPGIPYMADKPTNGEWLGWNEFLQDGDPARMQQLWRYVQDEIQNSQRKQHIYRVFVKDEMHKQAKAEEGRWRLIIAAALPQQVVWQMVFRHSNDKLIEKAATIPAAQGTNFCKGGWKLFRARIQDENLKYAIDKQAWDINAPAWVFKADVQLRKRLCDKPDPVWFALAQRLYAEAFGYSHELLLGGATTVALSDGSIFEQQRLGFMKSGLVNTISANSNAQVFMHLLACNRLGKPYSPIIACGDDTLQAQVSDAYLDELEKAGCVVKEVQQVPQFMGFDFANTIEPIYLAKHLATISHAPSHVVGDILHAYLSYYAHSPYFEQWQDLSLNLGFTTYSKEYYLAWNDNPNFDRLVPLLLR